MNDSEKLQKIIDLLEMLFEEPEEEYKKHGSPPKPSGNGGGGFPQVAIVASPLSGEKYMWLKRPVGDSWIEEIKSIVNFGEG